MGDGGDKRTSFMFPRSLAYSSKTSCSSGVRDSASEGGWEVEVERWGSEGGLVAMMSICVYVCIADVCGALRTVSLVGWYVGSSLYAVPCGRLRCGRVETIIGTSVYVYGG